MATRRRSADKDTAEATVDVVPPMPPELVSLRSALGAALFDVRTKRAKALHARFCRARSLMAGGICQLQALREVFGEDAPSRSSYARWRKGGLWALVPRHAGPPRRSPPPGSKQGGAVQLALSLSPARPASPRAGRFRGLLRLPGTKAGWVERLASSCPAGFQRYFEPFVGSGALFFHLKPARAVLSDLNSEFINLYRALRDEPDALIEALSPLEDTEAEYYRARGLLPASLPPVQRAARTYFLNQTCFNGIYRVNRAGIFNVPYGQRRQGDWKRLHWLRQTSRLLAGVELREGDFEAGLQGCGPGDFVYLDPPYDLPPGATRLDYQRGGFAVADQERLAGRVRALHARGVRFLVSNADTPRIRELYRGFTIEEVQVRRRVGGHTNRRQPAAELLIGNQPSPSA